MINMTITELYCTFTDFAKIGISGVFSLYNINFCRNAMAGGGGEIIVFRLQRSSVRISVDQ
jgi:hypothetical protein